MIIFYLLLYTLFHCSFNAEASELCTQEYEDSYESEESSNRSEYEKYFGKYDKIMLFKPQNDGFVFTDFIDKDDSFWKKVFHDFPCRLLLKESPESSKELHTVFIADSYFTPQRNPFIKSYEDLIKLAVNLNDFPTIEEFKIFHKKGLNQRICIPSTSSRPDYYNHSVGIRRFFDYF
jgi:hypothetical protein